MKMNKILVPEQDYVVRVVDLKTINVEGIIISGVDLPTIIINGRLSAAKQQEALRHELKHLANDDLYDEVHDVAEIERRLQ